MLDSRLRPLIDPPLAIAARWLVARRITADQVTVAAFAFGIAAAACIAIGWTTTALALLLLNRAGDGIDGAIARQTKATDRGGFLDISLDFVVYAAIPLAFAIRDPVPNALPATALLSSFLANGAAFLAFAIVASKRGLSSTSQGSKSFFFVAGLAEGTETVLVFTVVCLWPTAFPMLALGFAFLCGLSAAARIVAGWRSFQ
ncbi:MAG: CDP-alcohol phosphatidyltransferase family protein [Hyphomicrobiaceae bacterium]